MPSDDIKPAEKLEDALLKVENKANKAKSNVSFTSSLPVSEDGVLTDPKSSNDGKSSSKPRSGRPPHRHRHRNKKPEGKPSETAESSNTKDPASQEQIVNGIATLSLGPEEKPSSSNQTVVASKKTRRPAKTEAGEKKKGESVPKVNSNNNNPIKENGGNRRRRKPITDKEKKQPPVKASTVIPSFDEPFQELEKVKANGLEPVFDFEDLANAAQSTSLVMDKSEVKPQKRNNRRPPRNKKNQATASTATVNKESESNKPKDKEVKLVNKIQEKPIEEPLPSTVTESRSAVKFPPPGFASLPSGAPITDYATNYVFQPPSYYSPYHQPLRLSMANGVLTSSSSMNAYPIRQAIYCNVQHKPMTAEEFYQQQHASLYDYHRSIDYHMSDNGMEQKSDESLKKSPAKAKNKAVEVKKNKTSRTMEKGRRNIFDNYYPNEELAEGIENGTIIQGQLRINRRNRMDAWVVVEGDGSREDIFVFGHKMRNRALEGDTVFIELLNSVELEQTRKAKAEHDKERRREKGGAHVITDAEEEEPEDLREWGKVVGVGRRDRRGTFAGTLLADRPGSKQQSVVKKGVKPKIVWFKPVDSRVPLMAIMAEDVGDVINDLEAHRDELFVVYIKRWPIFSHHPFAALHCSLGKLGDIEVETKAFLAGCNIITDDFSKEAKACLPSIPWEPPISEISVRRDLRCSRIFTIDPATSKDLDDALSCRILGDGNLEVGVHIADASYFVQMGSALDREARQRATSVYLVQKVLPMLPTVLSEDYCSLNPGKDRLTFSVIWKMNNDGQILETWFGRTVISSCCKLSYEHAQSVIDNRSLTDDVVVYGNHQKEDIEADIRTLNRVSRILRSKRYEEGALSINSIKLCFSMDKEGIPEQCWVKESMESNHLIEEYMLLANISVANKIASHFFDEALLRRHQSPIERRMVDFVALAEKLGYHIDASSAGSLQRSLQEVKIREVQHVLKVLCIKPMHRAKYFCAGTLPISAYSHYALNVPFYTHFTSPIRRYADIVVHRLLWSALEGNRLNMTQAEVQKIANECNNRKDAAKSASDQSNNLFLATHLYLLSQRDGPVVCEAVVVEVHDRSVDVLVPKYGVEKRIYMDKLPLNKFAWDDKQLTLTLFWQRGVYVSEMNALEEEVSAEEEEEVLEDEELLEGEDLGGEEVIGNTTEDVFSLDDEDHIAVKSLEVENMCLENSNNGSNMDDEAPTDIPISIPIPERRRRSSSVVGTPSVNATSSSRKRTPTISGELKQEVRVFDRIKVLVTADIKKSPPAINVIAVNPFA